MWGTGSVEHPREDDSVRRPLREAGENGAVGGMNGHSFRPHPLVRGGHAQTLLGFLLPGRQFPYAAKPHEVVLEDGDRLVVHDDRPESWRDGDPVAIVMHGLAGCHQSPYVNRVSGKLNERGVRTFRPDHRGCGAGVGLATRPYHAGRCDDLRSVVDAVESEFAPGSPIAIVGYSLSGNIVLKYLGERPDDVSPAVESAVAVCPAADLPGSQVVLRHPVARMYDRYLTDLLCKQYRQFERNGNPRLPRPFPRRLREFDEAITAPLWGFEDAETYHREVSAVQWLDRIVVPTLLVASRDDPIIPVRSFEAAPRNERVRMVLTESGGHLGFVGREGTGDPDRRWIDWRILDWLHAHNE